MDKLLECTEVHTVFLDAELRIRKFTPRIAKSFNILAQDIGRPIDSFAHSIDSTGVADKIRRVVATGQPYEEEVRDATGGWYLMRIVAYRASAIDGEADSGRVGGRC